MSQIELIAKANDFLKDLLASHNINLSERQCQQFQRYYQLLIEWNQKINLTAITDLEEVYIKHFYDSVTLAIAFPKVIGNYKIIDIGSGAGFPGIPLKIVFPDLQITFLDSLNKRINYLKTVASELELTDCQFVHGRAEELGQNLLYREQYDFAVARAVAKLAVLNELCTPFVKVNGSFFSMKGPDVAEELTEAKKSLQILKTTHITTYQLQLPNDHGGRSIIQLKKIDKTPKSYPRKAGTPAKLPLV